MNVLKAFKNALFHNTFSVDKEPIDFFNKTRLLHFVIQLFQLIGVLAIINLYKIEKNSGIIEYSWIVFVAFIFYSFTKIQYKHFVLITTILSIIFLAFGFINGLLFLLISAVIITVCLLNIKSNLKLCIIWLIFIVFAIGRCDFFNSPRISTLISYILPIFMFRVFILLYELKNGLKIKSIWQVIVYFFLLPNIFFLFFPIVDYKTYQNTYYNEPEKDIWQKGIRWMLRGIFHLFMYRIISTNFLYNQENVNDIFSLLAYLISNYTLIVRLSGIFHLIIGLLCMFGMNLPATFDNYFIATSFVDLWRRINIYWRDFILKIFFYPIMFIYKKKIKKYLLPVTMLSVFLITFILHSYQLFWITGNFNLRLVDLVFWLTVGILITINSMIIEYNSLNGKKKIQKNTFQSYSIKTLKMVGMILFMSTMWGLWNSKTLTEWIFLMSYISTIRAIELIQLLVYLIIIVFSGTIIHYIINLEISQKLIRLKPSQTLFLTAPVIILILCLQNYKKDLPHKLSHFIQALSNDIPNTIEKHNAEIGYYDRLIEGDEDVTIGIGTKGFKKKFKKNPYNLAYYISEGLLNRRMKPNLNIKGLDHNFVTNEYGIRDKAYNKIKGNKTFRFVLLGGSYEMGSGVSNHQNFEYITEEKLNNEMLDSNYQSLEIWNFAAGGYYLIEHLELLNTEVFKYKPDAVIYFAHSNERNKMIQDITNSLKRKVDLKYPFLKRIVTLTGLKPTMSNKEIKERLNPYIDCILQWAYIEIAKNCKVHHAKPIWVYLLTTEDVTNKDEYEAISIMAKNSGYITLNLDNVYSTLPRKDIQISDINTHPNVLGHKLIAKDFYKQLMLHRKEIFEK